MKRSGYVFPSALVSRVMDVWALVRAVGWEGAKNLAEDTFTGWEVGFLRYALGVLSEWDREQDRRAFLAGLGGRA